MSKRDVELIERHDEVRLLPRSEPALQFMAENFFSETYEWDGNMLVVEIKRSEIVIAILEDAGFVVK